MHISFIKKRIADIKNNADIIVLKGFPIEDVLKLTDEYKLLDQYAIEGKQINLTKINAPQLLQDLFLPINEACLLLYESFLDLTTLLRNLNACQKKFYILTNNLFTKYSNQTTTDIPDFDCNSFQDSTSENDIYVKFYSYCMHINDMQYVQYIEHYLDNDDEIQKEALIPPTKIKLSVLPIIKECKILSKGNGSIDCLLENIYYHRNISHNTYFIEKQDTNDELLGVLQSASDLMNLDLHFYLNEDKLNVDIRKDLYTIMENTWGYTSFRNLKMYEDLTINRNVISISQGEIIETVVQQAEAAITSPQKGFRNVLLTSPTGAGKSLLFQLAAIYLAETYHALTIVISPLVALMNDQVENLVGSYKGVATLNGNIPPSQKEEIINKVKEGEINILYLAPELLLSYTLPSFIGERKLGLFVVDEAHTVTTWGRDFRVDYWFLGDYLRQSKRVIKYNFPIFALTATAVWDISGKNDMVFDTIRSLNMDPCIKFIGVVRRDDITFEIENPNFTHNYEKLRNKLTIQRINECVANREKTIVYFPFKSTINKLMRDEDIQDYLHRITEYHASLYPAEKNLNAEGFKKGEKTVMCATKAYGMGIDVSDIKKVYHHAPTGSLSDYVQEIGRVARDPHITGIAKIDFSETDFRFTRTLHGLSAIKTYQLRAVLKKLMALYKLKGEKRNMLITSSDFEYIFPGKNIDFDQKVKSCLLLLSHDLKDKLGFDAIIVRPKNLFSKSYIKVPKAQSDSFYAKYKNFVVLVDRQNYVYKLDSDNLWNKHYSHYSFADFKRKLAIGDIFRGYNIEVNNKLEVNLNSNHVNFTQNALSDFFTYSHKVLDCMALERRRVSFMEMKEMLPSSYTEIMKEAFVETFKMVYATDDEVQPDLQRYCKIYNEFESIQLKSHGYERVKSIYMNTFEKSIKNTENVIYCSPYSLTIKVCELLNSLNLADYQRLGGEQPAIFVRINNPVHLNDLVRRGSYTNKILNSIYEKYEYSEWVFNYFFTTKMTNKQRWNFIEAYFLGASKEDLIKCANL